MSNVLYLVHRIPYPPNKGDKVRSFNILKHLSSAHQVFLGSFIDAVEDEQYIDRCAQYCEEVKFVRIDKKASWFRSALSVFGGESVSVSYYRDRVLQRWISSLLESRKIDVVFLFSGVMAQFVPWQDMDNQPLVLVDFVDVDSLKWADYAGKRRFLSAWFFRREGQRLLAYERAVARRADASFFVAEREAAAFRALAPESGERVFAVENGVDMEFFRPSWARKPMFSDVSEKIIVFTGAMDYWPNVDAVQWFVEDILMRVKTVFSSVHFFIVGRNPTRSVSLLAGGSVTVTGQVADVRPYLQFADLVVAPLRVARGVQNKVLEAMAMERAVVASSTCTDSLHPTARIAISVADDAQSFASNVVRLLQDPEAARSLGTKARQAVVEHYSWQANLSRFDRFLVPHRSSIR